MIRTNLSSRPFYNERAVRLWLLLAGILVASATIFNIVRVAQYSGSNTELAVQASADERRAAELQGTAVRLRASVDAHQMEAASIEARLANELIDRRTFSWTELFNRFETTLPPDVRITAVRPLVDKEHKIVLTVTVLAKSVDDVGQFMENLESTGAFMNLLSRQERLNEDDQIESVLETIYVPHRAGPEPQPETAAGTPTPASAKETTR